MHDGKKFDFSDAVFSNPEGEEFKALKNLNEPTHAKFIAKNNEFIKTATKEELATLQTEIRGKTTEVKELQTN